MDDEPATNRSVTKTMLQSPWEIWLKIESESYLNAETRHITIIKAPFVINGRFDSYCARKEISISGFNAQPPIGLMLATTPAETVPVDSSAQVNAGFVEVKAYTGAQRIFINRLRPIGSGIYHQGYAIGKESTDLCAKA